jgi:hypothetical protein
MKIFWAETEVYARYANVKIQSVIYTSDLYVSLLMSAIRSNSDLWSWSVLYVLVVDVWGDKTDHLSVYFQSEFVTSLKRGWDVRLTNIS